ncbi:DUF5996 family protein [Microbacterium sp. P05]|uniref:DUF5996 family protein n=1 Tax=Microbacterium sp. P05 TaxID=3366948 RepID=UPI003745E10D
MPNVPPPLLVETWTDTRDTLHMWLQIIGKLRMACTPPINHWWHVALFVNARGLTTGAVPYEDLVWEAQFDFVAHELVFRASDGRQESIPLRPVTVAEFYRAVLDVLSRWGLSIPIFATPNEVADAIPFAEDTVHASYDASSATAFWQQLVYANGVLSTFRSGFDGKASPVHFFWGAMDLAVTRFSGREAPPHPGGVPNCPDSVMREGYSHELSSAGFWPGGGEEGAFYSYVYPATAEFSRAPAGRGFFNAELGEFVLPLERARGSDDPRAVVLEFLDATYAAAYRDGGWDASPLADLDAGAGSVRAG